MTKEMRLERGLLKISEVAKETDLAISTIRYYTEIGLLKVLEHTDSGYRLYRKDDTISIINIIKEAKGRIPSLADIKRNYEVAE